MVDHQAIPEQPLPWPRSTHRNANGPRSIPSSFFHQLDLDIANSNEKVGFHTVAGSGEGIGTTKKSSFQKPSLCSVQLRRSVTHVDVEDRQEAAAVYMSTLLAVVRCVSTLVVAENEFYFCLIRTPIVATGFNPSKLFVTQYRGW